jgi:hypothetical protein
MRDGRFGRSPIGHEQGGGAKRPLAAAWVGADARCLSTDPRVRPGDNTRPGGCPAAPSRAISIMRGSALLALRHTQKIAPERSPRRTSRPAVPCRDRPGVFSRRGGTRTPSSLIRVKGQEAVRQIDFCDWGWAILAGSGRYNRHLSFHRRPSRLPCARAHAGPALTRLRP